MIFKMFQKYPHLRYGVSEKNHGSMKMVPEDFTRSKNKTAFFKKLGILTRQLVTPIQSHSGRAGIIDDDHLAKPIPGADGLVTNLPDVFLTVSVADCFPVYFFDKKEGTVGLAHCGWRGIIKKLPKNTVLRMKSNPQNILAGIGPGIQNCHFQIQNDILEKFSGYPGCIIRRDGKIFVDLPRVIKSQLISAGLNPRHIENFGECTYCQQGKYFSFRRDRSKILKTMVAYMGLVS